MKHLHTIDLPISKKDLILKLIKEDMRATKLVLGLEHTGLSAYPFFTDLSRIVFLFMGFTEEDCEQEELQTLYENFMDKTTQLDASDFPGVLNELAFDLYIELLAEKKIRDRKS
jgi:hypothetical protein